MLYFFISYGIEKEKIENKKSEADHTEPLLETPNSKFEETNGDVSMNFTASSVVTMNESDESNSNQTESEESYSFEVESAKIDIDELELKVAMFGNFIRSDTIGNLFTRRISQY